MRAFCLAVIVLTFLSCDKEKKIEELMAILIENSDIHAGEHSDHLEYRGNCKCYIKHGYVGESVRSESFVFDLGDVTEVLFYEEGHISLVVPNPDSVGVAVFEGNSREGEEERILALYKKEIYPRLPINDKGNAHEQSFTSIKEVLDLCGAKFKVYTYINREKVEIEK